MNKFIQINFEVLSKNKKNDSTYPFFLLIPLLKQALGVFCNIILDKIPLTFIYDNIKWEKF